MKIRIIYLFIALLFLNVVIAADIINNSINAPINFKEDSGNYAAFSLESPKENQIKF